jgi:hypothetical protein
MPRAGIGALNREAINCIAVPIYLRRKWGPSLIEKKRSNSNR